MVGSRYRWNFSNTFCNMFGQTSHLDHSRTFLKFFSGISHLLTFSHVSWWSTALRTAKTTRRRRPSRSLKLGCSTSVGIFFQLGCDMLYWFRLSSFFLLLATCLTTLSTCSWWLTTLWTARTTWRRRPARSLTLGGS